MRTDTDGAVDAARFVVRAYADRNNFCHLKLTGLKETKDWDGLAQLILQDLERSPEHTSR